jgi:enoyl-CoA hydratase/carnithine racemase
MRLARYELRGRTALITLDDAEHRNGMTLAMMADIIEGLRRAEGDPEVRAVVVTGDGVAFSVGARLYGPETLYEAMIDDVEGHTPDGYREPAGRISEYIHRMPIPVIAAVNGDAIGGGATIATAMDVRIVSTAARFGYVFARRGVTAEGASTWFLPRVVGLTRAADWLLSGRVFDSAEAAASGLATEVVAPGDVLPRALEYAEQFATTTSPQSVAYIKRLLAAAWGDADPGESAGRESRVYAGLTRSDDALEGIRSFLERREPVFTSTGRDL